MLIFHNFRLKPTQVSQKKYYYAQLDFANVTFRKLYICMRRVIQNKDYPKKLLQPSKFNARACDIIITEAVMIM